MAGLFLIAFALLARHLAQDLPMGRMVRMGPGYLPTVLAWTLGGLGVLIAARGFLTDGPKLEPWAMRPLMALCGALIAFALLLQKAGLVVAIIVTTVVASFAAPGANLLAMVVLGGGMSALSIALFIWLLGLPLTIWPDLG